MAKNEHTSFFSEQDTPWERRIARMLAALEYIGMAFVILMMTLTVVHAVGRYGFDQPITGLIEMSCFMLVIIIFLTIPHTQVMKGHICITLVVDRFPQRTQAIIDSITYTLSLALSIVALWQSVVRGIYLSGSGYVTAMLGIPHFPFVFIVALGWGLIALAILLQLIHFIGQAVRGSG